MMTLLRLAADAGHRIEYIARETRGMERYVHDVEALGVKVHGPDPERLAVWHDAPGPTLDLEGILRDGSFDLAILVLWFWTSPTVPEQYLESIRGLSPKTRIIVLSDDVHWLHEERLASISERTSGLERAAGYRAREREILQRADLVATITPEDAERYRDDAGDVPIDVLPHCVPAREGRPPSFGERRGVTLVGSFGYHANVDGALWFAREVWPKASPSLRGAKLRIVGSNPPEEIKALAGESIEVAGWVPSITCELDSARVFVSPVRYGTGLKTKNIQAMASGIPVVGTTVSLEGSGAFHGENAYMADEAGAFARAIVRLHSDGEAWRTCAAGGSRLAAEQFGEITVRCALERILRRARALPLRPSTSELAATEEWSIARVEEHEPLITTATTAAERFRARMESHSALASAAFDDGRNDEAIDELRRLLAHVQSESFDAEPAFGAGIMRRFAAVHAAAGRSEESSDCAREADALSAACAAGVGSAAEDQGFRGADSASRPAGALGALPGGGQEPVSIEGRRGFAFLCPAGEDDDWAAPLGCYVKQFTPEDDVTLVLIGPPDRLDSEIHELLRRDGLDPETVPDVAIVAGPADNADLSRYVAAVDAVLLPGSSTSHPAAHAADRLGLPVIRAGRDDLRAACDPARVLTGS